MVELFIFPKIINSDKDIMTPKKTKKIVAETVSVAKDVAVCQNCKAHRNSPSFCKEKNTFVGRKSTCENFSL
jgi:hypothetical protein